MPLDDEDDEAQVSAQARKDARYQHLKSQELAKLEQPDPKKKKKGEGYKPW